MARPSWDRYFLDIAAVVAKRSTCKRVPMGVGAVLVRDRCILSTGYAGSIRGQPHCVDVGCDTDPVTGSCQRTVHAETNAILQAAKHGVGTQGATLYCTLSPCANCFKMLANAGIKKIVYTEQYRVAPDFELADACGIDMYLALID
jgi:dCMP deaminase